MLSVSGLQAALKRRNSKVHRDNVVAPGNLGLPSALRRFSSSEVLAGHLQSPPPAPSVATVARKSSFSRRIRKVSTGNNQSENVDGCTVLDMHIAQIKRKLADFREEDVEMSERVEELTSCLSNLCHGYRIPVTPFADQSFLVGTEDSASSNPTHYNSITPTDQLYESNPAYHNSVTPTNQLYESNPAYHNSVTPTNQLYESNSQGDSTDDEDFQKFCSAHPHLANSGHLGYSTLPLPPPRHRQGDKKVLRSSSSASQPLRSHSYKRKGHMHTKQSRNYHPQDNDYFSPSYQPTSFLYEERVYDFRPTGEDSKRPVSYQEMSYEEDEYHSNNLPDNSWTELSCP